MTPSRNATKYSVLHQYVQYDGVLVYKIHRTIYNKTVTKLFTILKKCFLPNLNPATYLKLATLAKGTGVCVSLLPYSFLYKQKLSCGCEYTDFVQLIFKYLHYVLYIETAVWRRFFL